ncbi:AP-5 complex subunit zeta-1-like [Babylonia areolata]|uniref:AP-5 complex subunit zeta-1-like n=1 Tax=Babylonia areolata TaxID=304850 RepID=UPI003FD4E122
MALSAVEAILFNARSASQEDVDKLCHKITELLGFPDKAAECCALLRQLFVLLQTSSVEPCVPKSLLKEMLKTLNRPEGERSGSRLCRLCGLVVKELMCSEQQVAEDLLPSPDQLHNKALLTTGYSLQGCSQQCLQAVLPAAVRWLCTKDFESQRRALSFLVGLSSLHGILQQEHVGETSEELCTWLMKASVYQAHNPSSINPFRKDQDAQVTEIDGTPCRNFFTILNIGQYYTDDQYLNIYSFSVLYKWLYHCSYAQLPSTSLSAEDDSVSGKSPAVTIDRHNKRKPLRVEQSPRRSPLPGREGSPKGESPVSRTDSLSKRKSPALSVESSPKGSPRRKSPAVGSLESQSAAGDGDGSVEGRSTPEGVEGSPRSKRVSKKGSVVSRELQSLVSRSVDYCFRVMDQCERKAKVTSDAELQVACLREVVEVLDLVCKLDRGQVARVHQEMRRLYTRLPQDASHCPTLLCILRFFLNHSAAVVHDPQEVYTHVFGHLLSQQFQDPGFAFDVVVFLCSNIDTLCYNTNILAYFFPNILKILAWHPRTFLTEFLDILPAMMSPTTALEVLHTLLDLPCMTAALEVMERAKKVEPFSVNQGTGMEPANCVDAFHTPRFKPLFNFVCRTHAGQGDTINRLSSLHKVLEEVKTKARVTCCAQVVPLMLRRWFQVIREEAEEEFVMQIIPALLERSGLLFDLADFKADVILIMGEEVLGVVEEHPAVLVQHITDITDFLQITSNVQGRPDLYGNLIYCIGEYASTQRAPGCTPELIGQYFDMLEVVTYELCRSMTMEDDDISRVPKILCHLMSAMAKLSTRRQDLIPRAILCLTKVAKQHFTITHDPLAQEALVTSAQEHINLLQVPNFAVTVLNPPADIYSGKWHRDSYSLPRLVRGLHTMLPFSS